MEYTLSLWDKPNLKTKTRQVEEFGETIHAVSELCILAMQELDGVGLAANQIGFDHSLFVYKNDDNTVQTLVNPRIVSLYLPKQKILEACLSIPEYSFEVPRYTKVTVEAQDLHGNPLTIESEGLKAQIFQHEIDHLNGVRIIDRLSKADKKRTIRYLKRN